ncbi:MAG: glycosyltransferase family 4 protein [Planctomycetes bacterium]|nr:glycosyltransferase family 4 protein [Planctomycetota bacterium]
MFALPFDFDALCHRLFVVDAEPRPELAEELWREFAALDRATTRATLLSVGGPFRERDLVKGFGVELSEIGTGSLERRGFLARALHLRRRLREIAPHQIDLKVAGDRWAWRLAMAGARPPARPAAPAPRGARARDRIAFFLKSDASRQSAHVTQALHTAAGLASLGARVRVLSPLESASFAEALAPLACDYPALALDRIEHQRLVEVQRSARPALRLRPLLEELAAAGFGTLYFRQVRVASMLLPHARALGFRTFMEAHQPYTTWAVAERRRLWNGHEVARRFHLTMARWDRRYEQRCYRELSGVVATTRAMCRRVRRLDADCPVLLLRNGAPPSPAPATRLADEERPYDVVYAGKTSLEKGAGVLVQALARLQGARLLVVGGPTENEFAPFRALARELCIEERIEFRPWLPQAELFDLIQKAKVAVHPLPGKGSREWRVFTCPLKVLEYMALGTPVVATDLPALREIVRPGVSGLLVEPDRPEALAAGLGALLADPERAETLRRGALRRVRSLGRERRARRLLAFLAGSERAW